MTSEYKTTPGTMQKALRAGGLLSTIILAVSLAGIVFSVTAVLVNPLRGPRVIFFFLLFVCTVFFCNRLLLVLQKRFLPEDLKFYFRILLALVRWSFSLFVPFCLIPLVNNVANARSLTVIEKTFLPVVAHIDRVVEDKGSPPPELLDILMGIKGVNFVYFYGDHSYLLKTFASSIDMDGATIFYSSISKQWRRVHNDLLYPESASAEAKRFFRETGGLSQVFYRYDSEVGLWQR